MHCAVGQRMLLTVIAVVAAAQTIWAHPICLDSTAPIPRQNSFSICPQYNGLPTCASPANEATVVKQPTYSPGVPQQCRNMLKDIACSELDQWAGHLYRAEGPGDFLEAPKLCQDYCLALYGNCSSFAIANSPFVQDSATQKTIASLYPTSQSFCQAFADSTYCYRGVPYSVPPAEPFNPSFSLCVEKVIAGGEPKASMAPVPGHVSLMMAADLEGVVRIYSVTNNVTNSAFTVVSTLLDIRSFIDYGGERGLLGVAFHKNYRSNGRFYVSYSCKGAAAGCTNGDSIVEEFRVTNPGSSTPQADRSTRRRIFRTAQPFANHNGGQILFSPDPADPHLYLMLGDGGSGGDPGNRAQPLTIHLGKILRIDVDSTFGSGGLGVAPSDNPFVNTPNAIPLIWTNGMRNPWRCSFDRQTYLMYCGDVGQDSVEEIDIITKGSNYGWSRIEGTTIYNSNRVIHGSSVLTQPILTYTHNEMGGFASVTGGYVVRTNRDPRMTGKYLFADLSGPVFLAQESPANSGQWSRARIGVQCAVSSPLDCNVPDGAYSFGEMIYGDILYADGSGSVWRFVEPARCSAPTARPTPSPVITKTPTRRPTGVPTAKPSRSPTSIARCESIRRKTRCRRRRDCRVFRSRCITRGSRG